MLVKLKTKTGTVWINSENVQRIESVNENTCNVFIPDTFYTIPMSSDKVAEIFNHYLVGEEWGDEGDEYYDEEDSEE